jgi:hypothetical protein
MASSKLRDGESGTVVFNSDNTPITAVAAQVSPGVNICRVNYAAPTPCVLTIGTHFLGGRPPGVNGQESQDLAAGDPDLVGINGGNGFAEVVYGAGSCTQRLVMDLRSGTYQLPPITQASLVGTLWYNSSFIASPISVDGAFCEGSVSCGSRPTYTVRVPLLAAVGVVTQIPDKARYLDAWAYVTALGAGKPVLSVYDTGAGGSGVPSLVRDYTTGIWAPPYPAACFQPRGSVTVISTVDCTAYVQFELDF